MKTNMPRSFEDRNKRIIECPECGKIPAIYTKGMPKLKYWVAECDCYELSNDTKECLIENWNRYTEGKSYDC
jgi:hypothetical protein